MTRRVLSPEERMMQQMGMYTPQMLDELSDDRERERFRNLVVRLSVMSPAQGGKPWLVPFLVGLTIHTGRDGLSHTKTMAVWCDPITLNFHLAVNPFFAQYLQKIDVQRGLLPIDPALEAQLTSDNYQVVAYDAVPSHLRRAMEEVGAPPKSGKEWVAVRIDLGQQIAVLIHELLHLMHKHLEFYADRNTYPDAQVLNIAMDVAINQFIDNLPPEAYTPDTFAQDPHHPLELPKKGDFDTYYQLLTDYYKDAQRGQPPKPQGAQAAIQGFPAGTPVNVAGGTVPIERIKRGDRVLSVDGSGNIVERFVTFTTAKPAAVIDTADQFATDFFSMRTTTHQILRASGKIMLWVDGREWCGIGQVTHHASMTGTGGPPVQVTQQPAGQTALAPRDPIAIGEAVSVSQGSLLQSEPVVFVGTEARRPNEILYHLAVQPGLHPSCFFVNGILVRGLVVTRASSGDGGGDGPPPDPNTNNGQDIQISESSSSGQGPRQPGEGQGQSGGAPGEGQGQPGGAPGEGQGQPGGGQQPGQPGAPGSGQGQPGGSAGPTAPTPGPGQAPIKPPKRVPAPLDDHSRFDETKIPDRVWKEANRRFFRDVVNRMKSMGVQMPGWMHTLIEEILRAAQIDWRRTLRSWVGGVLKKGYRTTRKRPSRRHGWRVPGRRVVRGSTVWLAVDNSGSISAAEAEQFASEFLDMLKEGHDGVLIVWDGAIRQIKRITNRTSLVEAFKDLGGGGSSDGLPAVFEALRDPRVVQGMEGGHLLHKRPAGVIVFTDGHIVWPGRGTNLNLPVIWGITVEDQVGKHPFGDAFFVDMSL